jgi:hypothetical protein
MRLIAFIALLFVADPAAAGPRLRAPSCQALVAFALGSRYDPIEGSFGLAVSKMTVDDFDQAIDIVSVCIDEVEEHAPDIPGLMIRERKQPQLAALRELVEDLQLYRRDSRDRERRAAQHLAK